MWAFIISTIIYALVVWKVGPILEEHGLTQTTPKNIVLALIAFVLSILPIMMINYLEDGAPDEENQDISSLLAPPVSDTPTKPQSQQEKQLQDAMKDLSEYQRLSK